MTERRLNTVVPELDEILTTPAAQAAYHRALWGIKVARRLHSFMRILVMIVGAATITIAFGMACIMASAGMHEIIFGTRVGPAWALIDFIGKIL